MQQQFKCMIHGISYGSYCHHCEAMEKSCPSPLTVPEGLKYDAEKPPMQLLDPEAMEGVARVLGFGAKKYAAHNWRNGINYSRLIGAAYRHLGAINRGEDTDPESGLPHVDHLGCTVMFLSWMMLHRKDLDDRYKEKNNV